MAGIAKAVSQVNYSEPDFQLFFESLVFLVRLENFRFEEQPENDKITKAVLKCERENHRKKLTITKIQNPTVNEQFLKSDPSQLHLDFFEELLSALVMMVSDLEAATMKFHEVIGVTRMLSFKEF